MIFTKLIENKREKTATSGGESFEIFFFARPKPPPGIWQIDIILINWSNRFVFVSDLQTPKTIHRSRLSRQRFQRMTRRRLTQARSRIKILMRRWSARVTLVLMLVSTQISPCRTILRYRFHRLPRQTFSPTQWIATRVRHNQQPTPPFENNTSRFHRFRSKTWILFSFDAPITKCFRKHFPLPLAR